MIDRGPAPLEIPCLRSVSSEDRELGYGSVCALARLAAYSRRSAVVGTEARLSDVDEDEGR